MEVLKKDIQRFIKVETVGSGDGSGSGDGYGSGSGSGDGYGSGDGSGYGSGSGDGDGSGYGSKQKYKKKINYSVNGKIDNYKVNLSTWNNNDVYYIDGLPCTFISLKQNIAKVNLIDIDNLKSKECFIVKYENCFAHGNDIKIANQEAINKHFSLLNVDDKIIEFKKTFSDFDKKYSNQLFYEWHTILTGSCTTGKEIFIKNKSVDLGDSMSVNDFIELTKNEYNGEIIKKLFNG